MTMNDTIDKARELHASGIAVIVHNGRVAIMPEEKSRPDMTVSKAAKDNS